MSERTIIAKAWDAFNSKPDFSDIHRLAIATDVIIEECAKVADAKANAWNLRDPEIAHDPVEAFEEVAHDLRAMKGK
jgi:hypothetical protein